MSNHTHIWCCFFGEHRFVHGLLWLEASALTQVIFWSLPGLTCTLDCCQSQRMQRHPQSLPLLEDARLPATWVVMNGRECADENVSQWQWAWNWQIGLPAYIPVFHIFNTINLSLYLIKPGRTSNLFPTHPEAIVPHLRTKWINCDQIKSRWSLSN